MPRCHMRDELGLQAYVFVSGVALGIPAISAISAISWVGPPW